MLGTLQGGSSLEHLNVLSRNVFSFMFERHSWLVHCLGCIHVLNAVLDLFCPGMGKYMFDMPLLTFLSGKKYMFGTLFLILSRFFFFPKIAYIFLERKFLFCPGTPILLEHSWQSAPQQAFLSCGFSLSNRWNFYLTSIVKTDFVECTKCSIFCQMHSHYFKEQERKIVCSAHCKSLQNAEVYRLYQ